MSSMDTTRRLLVAFVVAGTAVTVAAYIYRRRRLATDRAQLIASTEEPLLNAKEQAVADGTAAESAEPTPALATPGPEALATPASAPSFLPVADALSDVRRRMREAAIAIGRGATEEAGGPCLVAVSKTKPVEMLQEAYAAGQRRFGENYVQELVAKASQMPRDVVWHFIGTLQSNKAKELLRGVPLLSCVETVDSAKLADRLQTAVAGLTPPRTVPLDIMLQVNTSPWEGSKGGVLAEDVGALAAHVAAACPLLRLVGLMTIGAPGDSTCFKALRECRDALASVLGQPPEALSLSMGMSGDFEAAISAGSDSVRVGSSIFGARAYPAKGKDLKA
jgi:pyridoxal phosphate enzyme (YggS family)